MKYLRLFESNGIIEDIKDICLELEDIGLDIEVGRTIRSDDTSISSIVICRPAKDSGDCFDYKDVREVIERIKEYLGDRIHYVMVGSVNSDEDYYTWNELAYSFDNPEDVHYLDDVSEIIIEFKV